MLGDVQPLQRERERERERQRKRKRKRACEDSAACVSRTAGRVPRAACHCSVTISSFALHKNIKMDFNLVLCFPYYSRAYYIY